MIYKVLSKIPIFKSCITKKIHKILASLPSTSIFGQTFCFSRNWDVNICSVCLIIFLIKYIFSRYSFGILQQTTSWCLHGIRHKQIVWHKTNFWFTYQWCIRKRATKIKVRVSTVVEIKDREFYGIISLAWGTSTTKFKNLSKQIKYQFLTYDRLFSNFYETIFGMDESKGRGQNSLLELDVRH